MKNTKETLYTITLADGSIYVGASKNFEARKRQHKYEANNRPSAPIHVAMSKQEYEFNVIFESDDRELISSIEHEMVKQMIEAGANVLNVKSSKRPEDPTYNSGALNAKYNPIEAFETKPITRGQFKELCARRGYDFNNFEEVESVEKQSGAKKYYYIAK